MFRNYNISSWSGTFCPPPLSLRDNLAWGGKFIEKEGNRKHLIFLSTRDKGKIKHSSCERLESIGRLDLNLLGKHLQLLLSRFQAFQMVIPEAQQKWKTYKGEKEQTSMDCANTPYLVWENGIAMTLSQGATSSESS